MDSAPLHMVCVWVCMYGLCLVYRYTCCKYVWYRYIWILHLCTGCVWVCMYGLCLVYRYTCRIYVWYSYIRILRPCTGCVCGCACMACVYHTGTHVEYMYDIGIYGFCALAQGVCVSVHVWHMYSIQIHILQICIIQLQGGEDSWDALSCRSCFEKEPLIIGLFCGKWPVKIRHPMALRHPVYTDSTPLDPCKRCVWVCMCGTYIYHTGTCVQCLCYTGICGWCTPGQGVCVTYWCVCERERVCTYCVLWLHVCIALVNHITQYAHTLSLSHTHIMYI